MSNVKLKPEDLKLYINGVDSKIPVTTVTHTHVTCKGIATKGILQSVRKLNDSRVEVRAFGEVLLVLSPPKAEKLTLETLPLSNGVSFFMILGQA